MATSLTKPETTVRLFVRTGEPAVWNQQRSAIEKLEKLEDEGTINHFSVEVWGREICLSGALAETEFHRSAREYASEFEAWADEQESSVSLPFDRREFRSAITGERFETLAPPTLCLAVYERGDLEAVFPCREEHTPCSIHEALESFNEMVDTPLSATT
ncbi:MAG: HTH domain-containing protein [Halobacteriota archaeon]